MSAIICTVFSPMNRPEPRFAHWVAAREFTEKTTRFIEYDATGLERWRAMSGTGRYKKQRPVVNRIVDAMHPNGL